MTRHREKAELFVARNTAPDIDQLARQMARTDDRRAASMFYPQQIGPVRPLTAAEILASFGGHIDRSDRHTARAERGPVAAEMEREGKNSHAVDDRRAAQERNRQRMALAAALASAAAEIGERPAGIWENGR